MACGDRCLTCKTAVRRMRKAAEAQGWTVDMAGGGWWVWDRIGNVLGAGNTKMQALRAAFVEVA